MDRKSLDFALLKLLTIVVTLSSVTTNAFVVSPPCHYYGRLYAFPRLNMMKRRTDVTIPLLDLSDSEQTSEIITPLPSAHLPSELGTLHLYGMELKRPIHKMLIEQVVQDPQNEEHVYGYIVDKPDEDSLVGAVGCTAEVLVEAHPEDVTDNDSEVGDDSPIVVLCRGSYRFVVREVVKTFPFPVAVVDELMDEEPSKQDASNSAVESDSIVEDDHDVYYKLDATELVRRIMMGLNTLIDQKLENKKPELSPLEKSILEETGAVVAIEADGQQAEEMAAVFDIFQSSLIDIAPMPVDRYYAIAMLAAEMANVDNNIRKELLVMRNGVDRMRIVLRELEEELSMNQARKVADSITDELDEGSKELKVGEPTLPPWIKAIKDGTRIEYFWNEEEGWCAGVVDGEPMKVLDEVIVNVRFDDGETHRLPITADEKVRWRPPRSG